MTFPSLCSPFISELGGLNIGSRPAKRKTNGGIETLRAIPWIFAWTQTRLHLPVWLGIGEAFEEAIEKGQLDLLKEMYATWPFFQVREAVMFYDTVFRLIVTLSHSTCLNLHSRSLRAPSTLSRWSWPRPTLPSPRCTTGCSCQPSSPMSATCCVKSEAHF